MASAITRTVTTKTVTLTLSEEEAVELRAVLGNVPCIGQASNDPGAAEIRAISEALDGAGFTYSHFTDRWSSRIGGQR